MNRLLEAAKIIWEYCKLSNPVNPSDYILALGSYDCVFVALKAAELYKSGLGSKIIVSGGVPCESVYRGQTLKGLECDIMKNILLQNGIPEEVIVIENKATNTGDNFAFSLQLMENPTSSLIAVSIPFIERRASATADVHCHPQQKFSITSFDMSFKDYMAMALMNDRMHKFLNVLVGSINRLIDYPNKGFQSHQTIPEYVLIAKRALEDAGFKGDYQLEGRQIPKRTLRYKP